MPPRISANEHRQRLAALQEEVARHALDVLIVSSFESIFYLTGAGFEPLERPFFLLVRAEGPPTLLVPKLDHQHMQKAHGIQPEQIVTYWEYPSPDEHGWPCRLKSLLEDDQVVGVEPSLRREISDELQEFALRTAPLWRKLVGSSHRQKSK